MKFTLSSLLSLASFCLFSQVQPNSAVFDSIFELRKLSEDAYLSKSERISFAKQAIDLSKKTKSDSTILKSERNLAYVFLLTAEYDSYESLTLNILEKAREVKDSIAIANSCNTLGYYYYDIKSDNSLSYRYYLEALKYFDALNIPRKKAEVLNGLASILDDDKDYLGSEQNAIKALRILNSLKNANGVEEDKYYVLNLLGLVSLKLENYDESITFHNQALDLVDKFEDGPSLKIQTLNNIGFVYREKGEYQESLGIFSKILKDPLLKDDMYFYGLVLNNYAFTKFLSGKYEFDDVEINLKKSLSISEQVENDYTKLAASIDLAKFYKKNKKLDSSLKYAKQSYKLAKAIPMNEYYLESMLILADLTQGEESKSYLDQHIRLTDSLLRVERFKRNKYARIEYKTDELQAENEQISKENLYLIILSVGSILTGLIVYLFISQRAKNRKLRLAQVESKANEDIYNLMREQQDKVDEARTLEKKRISEELHDGVLGRLFGTRLSLDSMNLKDGKDAIKTRAEYIGQLKTIEEDIRKISHELNTDFVAGSGFIDIVSELISGQMQAYELQYEFDHSDEIDWDVVDNRVKINIYRIIQEAMQNVYKHAQAKLIKISISLQKNVICLSIIDDGIGFDTSKNKKGIGLKNITSRVEDVNGEIEFVSKIGDGTAINIEIPYLKKST